MRTIKFRAWDRIGGALGCKQPGYQMRKAAWHPHANKRGYVMEHRLIMEEHMGAYLPKHAIIHHKNSIRDDNRIENLEYMPEQERHAKHHDSGKRNPNGQFVASSAKFTEKKFRLLNKNTGLMQEFTLAKLISTTFRNSQFEYRGEFTGLKDKTGKEIFEGDVVRVVYDGSLESAGGDDEVREVIWGAKEDEYYPAFDLKGNDMETNALSVAKNNGDIEVIGNIYKNPELLKSV